MSLRREIQQLFENFFERCLLSLGSTGMFKSNPSKYHQDLRVEDERTDRSPLYDLEVCQVTSHINSACSEVRYGKGSRH
jgi:hypothetical protein